eukprot:991210-Rhodomonas_salina.4
MGASMGHNDLGVRFVLENLTSTVFRRDTGLLKRLYLPLWYKCDVSTVSVIVSRSGVPRWCAHVCMVVETRNIPIITISRTACAV